MKVKGRINQISQIVLPVAAGLGYTVLPESMVKQFRPYSSPFVVPLNSIVKDEFFLVRIKHRFIGTRYEWFEMEIRRLIVDY